MLSVPLTGGFPDFPLVISAGRLPGWMCLLYAGLSCAGLTVQAEAGFNDLGFNDLEFNDLGLNDWHSAFRR
jgi:hypothetical protein